MNSFFIGAIAVFGTILTYFFAWRLHQNKKRVYTSPMIIGTPIIIVILLVLRIPYDTYMIGGEWISQLLGPAVVALAYPLYRQRKTLRRLAFPIVGGSLFGAMIGVITGILFARWLGFDEELIYSLTPKSVTTPVAMEITHSLGGLPALAAVFVVVAGVGGTLFSSFIFKYCRITHVVGRGVGIGSASHAIGTAAAMGWGQLEGSVSTIAMVVSAVFVSILTPIFIVLLL